MDEVRIEVLGPLRVQVDGVEQRLGGRREACRARAAGGGRRARGQCGAARRRGLGRGRPGVGDRVAAGGCQPAAREPRAPPRSGAAPTVLTRGPGGYALERVVVDVAELSEAATAVAGLEPSQAVARADAALALWRGEPYDGLADLRPSTRQGTRLAEDRLRLHEARAAALLEPRTATTRPRRSWPRWWATTRSASGCGRCWRWRSTAATARPRHSRRCAGSAPPWSTSSAWTRRPRCAPSRRTCSPRRPTSRRTGRRPRGAASPRRADASRTRACGVVGRTGEIAVLDGSLADLADRGSRGSAGADRRGGHRQEHARPPSWAAGRGSAASG